MNYFKGSSKQPIHPKPVEHYLSIQVLYIVGLSLLILTSQLCSRSPQVLASVIESSYCALKWAHDFAGVLNPMSRTFDKNMVEGAKRQNAKPTLTSLQFTLKTNGKAWQH